MIVLTGISDILAARAVDSVKLNHIENTEAKERIAAHEKTMAEIEESTKQIQKEARWIKETRTAVPPTPDFVKKLDILY